MKRGLAACKSRPTAIAVFLLPVLWIGALSACDSGTQATVSPSPSPTVPRGQAIFARYCNTCHPGGAKGVGPSLIERQPNLTNDQIRAQVRNGKNKMPAFGPSVISDQELTELIAYVRTFK